MVQDLQKINIFSDLTGEQLKIIKRICHKKKYKKGEKIFTEKSISPGLFVVLSGAVQVIKRLEDSKVDETIALIREGEFFGELSFMDGRPHSATTVAIRDTQLVVINKEDFDKLAKRNSLLAYEITKKIAHDIIRILRNMDVKFIDMMKFVWDRSR